MFTPSVCLLINNPPTGLEICLRSVCLLINNPPTGLEICLRSVCLLINNPPTAGLEICLRSVCLLINNPPTGLEICLRSVCILINNPPTGAGNMFTKCCHGAMSCPRLTTTSACRPAKSGGSKANLGYKFRQGTLLRKENSTKVKCNKHQTLQQQPTGYNTANWRKLTTLAFGCNKHQTLQQQPTGYNTANWRKLTSDLWVQQTPNPTTTTYRV